MRLVLTRLPEVSLVMVRLWIRCIFKVLKLDFFFVFVLLVKQPPVGWCWTKTNVRENYISSVLHRKLLQPSNDDDIIENSFVIKFQNRFSNNEVYRRKIDDLLSKCQTARLLHTYRLAISAVALVDVSDQDLLAILDDPDVDFAERDSIVYAFMQQDGLDVNRWGLDRIDQKFCVDCNETGTTIYDFARLLDPNYYGLPGVYRYDFTGKGVQAYIIDSGIQQMHNEFTSQGENGEIISRVTCGRNLRDNLNETCEDDWGHGTHVAGILGGRTFGVAKEVSLISVKVFGADASCRFADILAAIEFVMEQKESNPRQPMLINLSLGTSRVADVLNDAVNQAVDAGIPVVVAAGNGAVDACTYSPASAGQVLTVGATTPYDTYYIGSNYGRCIDLYAPGALVRSSWIGATNDVEKTLSGTSMAAPFVSGAVALHLQQNPAALPHTIRYYIMSGALVGALSSPTNASNPTVINYNPTPNILLNVQNLLVSSTPSSSDYSPRPTNALREFSDESPSSAIATTANVGETSHQAPTLTNIRASESGTSRLFYSGSRLFYSGGVTIVILSIYFIALL